MNEIDVTLPRTQWQRIHAAADKWSERVSYKKYPSLHMDYVRVYRTVGAALAADQQASEVTIPLDPVVLNSLHQLIGFQAFRQGLPREYPGSEWFPLDS